ncbi:hypothetical protein QE152_g13827 [Popillia japonica]|uniref:Uncharacterized protein n=1 Tax=Popillia japonica TaxID=7064 RepID=A0AAW1LCV5_POPJA
MTTLTKNVIVPLKNEIQKLTKENTLLSEEVKLLKNIVSSSSQSQDVAGGTKESQNKIKNKKHQQIKTSHRKAEETNTNTNGNDLTHTMEKIEYQEKTNINYASAMEKIEYQEKTNINYASAVKDNINNKTAHSTEDGSNNIIPEQSDYKERGEDRQEWKTVKSKSNRKRSGKPLPTVVGAQTNCTVKASARNAYLFVSRIATNTQKEDLLNFLRTQFPEADCEEITSRYPDKYKSFKVTIHLENYEAAMNPDIWPRDVLVTRFFHRRSRAQNNT